MTLKERILQKSNLWHLAAVAVFLLISCIYFMPALSGYVVEQGDVKNYAGAAQEIIDYRENGEQIGWTQSMFSGMPATQISMAYSGKQIPDALRSAYSLWLPSPISLIFVYFLSFYILAISFRAKPIVAIAGALAYGLSSYFIIIIEAGHVTKAIAVGYAPLLIAGFIFAYRWKNWLLGVGLSALFMTFQLSANHLQITYYLIFVLVALGATELYRYVKSGEGIGKFVKISAGMLVAYGIAVMINYGNIKGTAEYADATTRGGTELTIKADGSENTDIKTDGLDKEYITAWSYGKAETFTFLVPNFKGGETMAIGDNKSNDSALKKADNMYRNDIKGMNQYWGDQPFTSGPVYIGIIVVLLAVLGLVYSKEKSRWPLFIVTLLVVMLSWGKNLMGFTDIFLNILPGYDKFRAVTIILVIAELCVPLLAVFFLHKLYEKRDEIAANIKPFYYVGGGMLALLLLFMMLPSMTNSFLSDQEIAMISQIEDPAQSEMYESFFAEVENVRISIFRKDVGRSILFLILGLGAIFIFVRNIVSKNIAVGIVAVLILADLIMVDTRYLATEKSGKNYKQWVQAYEQKYPYVAGSGEQQILAMEVGENPELGMKLDSAMKVMNELVGNKKMQGSEKQRISDWYMFRTLNRYTNFRVLEEGNPFNSSYVSYFNKSIGGYHGAKLGRYQELIEFHLNKNNPAVLDMLNMKYTIRPQVDPASRKIVNSLLTSRNSTAMGNAWFAKEIKTVANADEEILALNSDKTYRIKAFGEHEILVNGVKDSVGIVVSSDLVELLFVRGIDSTGISQTDTIPVEVPFQAVTAETPLAWVLTEQGVTWDYAMNVDSTKIPLLVVDLSGRSGWDPAQVTVVDQRFKTNITQEKYSGEGTISMSAYHPDLISYSFNSPEKQLVVFSEIYYPVGWKAFVDNEEVTISRVNYVLRAIEVPAGEHHIEFVYEVDSYKSSGTMAWIGSILVLLLIGAGIYLDPKMPALKENELN